MKIAGTLILALSWLAGASPAQDAHLAYRQELVLQIGVANLDRSIEFYTKMLEFTLTERRDDLKFAHISTNVPGLEIGLNEIADPTGTGSVVINIGVVDVVAARTTLEKRGVSFRGETVIIPGKVALAPFSDPDGNFLRLAGPPPGDMKRPRRERDVEHERRHAHGSLARDFTASGRS